MNSGKNNYAFVDGQNLYLGTTLSETPWKIDLYRFRKYLDRKYNIGRAYYFLGCVNNELQDMYNMIQEAGFILIFREHSVGALSSKKGNVDTDIVFSMMKVFHEKPDTSKLFLVSGDGDYIKVVKYLRDQGRFGKVLLPSRKYASGLYNTIGDSYRVFLDTYDMKRKIGLNPESKHCKKEGIA